MRQIDVGLGLAPPVAAIAVLDSLSSGWLVNAN
jgi:hypothetical protein